MERGGPQELTRVCGLNTENKASGAAVAKGSDEGGGGGMMVRGQSQGFAGCVRPDIDVQQDAYS